MKKITDLKSDIASKEARMKAIFDKAELEKRSRTTEEATEWANLKNELVTMRQELADLEEQDKINRAAAKPVETPAVHTEKKDLSNFSLIRGLALLSENKPLDGAEAEVHAEAVKEARESGIAIQGFGVPAFVQKRGQSATGQTSATGDQGGVAVATEVNSLIQALWDNNFLSRVGATRLTGLVGNQTFPVQSTKPAATSRTEIQALSDTEILFGSISMSPNRRGVTIPISKQLLIQSSFDVQALVINQIRMALDLYLETDAITAILAAITGSNLVALGTNGVAPTYVDMVGLETIVAAANADKDLKYLTNSKVRGKLKLTQKFASTNGDPVWEKGNEVNGYPAVSSNIVPSNLTKGSASGICSAIVLGNFKDVYVGMWGGADFVVDPYTLAKSHSVQITANMFWDVEVARAASFAGIKDALTT